MATQEHAASGDGEMLGSYLKRNREAAGLSQDELVRRTGLSLSTIRKMEDGRTANPGFFTLLKVWRALSLDSESLMRLHEQGTGEG